MPSRTSRVGRQRILEVAEKLFTEQGYRAVSIREIAQNCSITNAALYYHFHSKEALFEEVMQQHASRLNARMRSAAQAPGSLRERVIAMLNEYARIVAAGQSPFFLFRGGPEIPSVKNTRQEWGRLLHAILLPLEDLLRLAMAEGALKPLPADRSPAALLVGMLHGALHFRQECMGEKFNTEDVQQVVDVFWDGLHNLGKTRLESRER